jgi:hypothetical protein
MDVAAILVPGLYTAVLKRAGNSIALDNETTPV